VSAENEIIHSLSTSYDIILSVISVFVSSLTSIGQRFVLIRVLLFCYDVCSSMLTALFLPIFVEIY